MPAIANRSAEFVSQNDMAADLIARAGAVLLDAPPRTPDNPGVLSLKETIQPVETLIFSAAGIALCSAAESVSQKKRWEKASEHIGTLASAAAVSATTGCWSIMKGRDAKGYISVYDARKYGLEGQADKRYGMRAHKLAVFLMMMELGITPVLPKGQHIDHLCRNTACCNPLHLEIVSNQENNERRRKAESIEAALFSNQQIIVPTGLEWLDHYIDIDDSGELTVADLLVLTGKGPYKIRPTGELYSLAAEREPCGVYDELKPPRSKKSKKKPEIIDGKPNFYVVKSRAKKHKPMEGEEPMFEEFAEEPKEKLDDYLLAASA